MDFLNFGRFFFPLSIATTAPAVIRPRRVMGTILEFKPLKHDFWDVIVRNFAKELWIRKLTCSAIEKLCDVIGRLVAPATSHAREPLPPLINVSCDL